MLTIFTERNSPRIEYVLRTLFDGIFRIPFEIIDDPSFLPGRNNPCLVYAQKPYHDKPFIRSGNLLFEEGVAKTKVDPGKWNDLPVLFSHKDERSLFPFDPLAMIFYLISCYEEYFKDAGRDMHGRIAEPETAPVRYGLHDRPVVNIIAQALIEKIKATCPEFEYRQEEYRFTPTYDIDMAFAHLGKGFVRMAAGYGKLLLKLNFREVFNRTATLAGRRSDPYDNFELQMDLHNELGLHPLYFVNLGDFGKYDKNVSWTNIRLHSLLKKLSLHADIGMHPSYHANEKPELYAIEKDRLEKILGRSVTKSRQHFLRLDFPETYRKLLDIGIDSDYSMGYAGQPGFRAGICTPFRFYDLLEEKETRLMVYPFAFMDASFLDYLKIDAEETKMMLHPLIRDVKHVQGHLMGIWHNYALADDPERLKNYREIIEMSLAE